MKKKIFSVGLLGFIFLFGFTLPTFACQLSAYANQGFTFDCIPGTELQSVVKQYADRCRASGQTVKTQSGFTLDCPSSNNQVCIGWKCEGELSVPAPGQGGGSSEVIPTNIPTTQKPTVVSTDGAECSTPAGVSFPCPLGQGTAENISTTIGKIIKWISGTIGALFLAMFVWGGVLFITAGGSSEKVKAAQGTMMSAVIGMVIIVFSFVLVDWLIGALASAL